jgi:NAD(P)-dependent dehydrogenase (short-subunit alcohol dehydrogenase family)
MNKIAIVTGASSGIGLSTASALAAHGYHVAMVCRDRDRGQAAQQLVGADASGPAPSLLIADLASQGQVRALAREIQQRFPTIDILVNNAGASFSERKLTDDGIERTFALNVLAPFLLTNLLLDMLKATSTARVVMVGSEIHAGKLDFDNLQGEHGFGFLKAYKASKLANLLLAYELARRISDTPSLTVNSVSPGPARTRFGDNMHGFPMRLSKIMKHTPMFAKPDKAARGPIYLATSPDMQRISGKFYLRTKPETSKKISYDPDVAARLWTVCDQLTSRNVRGTAR